MRYSGMYDLFDSVPDKKDGKKTAKNCTFNFDLKL